MAELLIELFSEEIPARMQAKAAEEFQRLVTTKLHDNGLHFTLARTYVTPRRLALVVEELPTAQPDVKEEKKGPRVGSPQPAIDGFLKSAGLKSLKDCVERDTGKGAFYFAIVEKKGAATEDVLPGLIVEAIQQMPWPKSMRFADWTQRWVRPLHGILAVFDGKSLAGSLPLGKGVSLAFTGQTVGHRFLSPDKINISNSTQYVTKLKGAKVIPDPTERRTLIWAQCRDRALKENLSVKPDDGLLDEVTGLVEWPVVLMGKIDQQFMSVPPEVLTTSMRTHQKYFALVDKQGSLAPWFLVVSNMETKDKGAQIVAGNERVLRARLSDAKFFWEQDLKVKLADRLPVLADIIFHAKLGSLAQKVSRIKALAAHLAKSIPDADPTQAGQAAELAKADLVSGMVGEFPELQGVMGRYYAANEGLPRDVAMAIADHYRPLGPNDQCPSAPVSVAVALADKIDSLVGFFAIDEKPTGSKDPFALRRAALGVIRLILENKLRLSLTDTFQTAFCQFDWGVDEKNNDTWVDIHGGPRALRRTKDSVLAKAKETSRALLEFFADRLKVALKEKGVRHDLISAVFALGDEDDLVRLTARVNALQQFVSTPSGADLLAAYRRAGNILRIETEKDRKATGVAGLYSDSPIDANLLQQDEEKALAAELSEAELEMGAKRLSEHYEGALEVLSRLRTPIDRFFDHVTVNVEDANLRANRLRLLAQIIRAMNKIADFSKIETKSEG